MTLSRPIPGAPLLFGLILLSMSHIHAFVAPFVPWNRVCSSKTRHRMIMTAAESASSSQSSSQASTSSSTTATMEMNRQLQELANQCGNPNTNVVSMASQCQDLFETCESPTVDSFQTVLQAWSQACATLAENSGNAWNGASGPPLTSFSPNQASVTTARDAAERATTLLLEMEARAQQQTDEDPSCIPDTACYNTVIDAWSKSRVEDAPQACERLLKKLIHHATLEPDIMSYNSVLRAWSHSSSEQALEKVNKIYTHLLKDENIQPTIQTMNTVLAAHAKQIYHARDKQAVAKAAHAILNEMCANPNVQPTALTYTSVMEAYAKCATLQATTCCQELLEQLQTAYAESNYSDMLQPNTRTYTALVTAWAKTKSEQAPIMAEAVVQTMENSTFAKPNTRTYTALISAWGRSRDATKPQRVLRILKHMKSQENVTMQWDTTRPNIVTYNAAIEACAKCQGTTKQQTEALKIAFAIFKSLQLDPNVEPNHVTYATVLKATAFLLPAGEERNKVASALFEKAKTAGMVDLNMLKNMRKAVDNNVMQDLFHDLKDRTGHIDYNNIPPAWSRNVR